MYLYQGASIAGWCLMGMALFGAPAGVDLLAQPIVTPKAVASSPDVLVATGRGRQPWRRVNKAQARLMAKRAAMVEAYKNMAGMLGMSAPRPRDGMGMEHVKGFIRGARLREARYYANGDVEVDIEMELPAGGGRKGSAASTARKKQVTDEELLFVEKGGGTISESEWRDLLDKDYSRTSGKKPRINTD